MRILFLHPIMTSLGAYESALVRTCAHAGDICRSYDYRKRYLFMRQKASDALSALSSLAAEIRRTMDSFQPDLVWVSKGEILIAPLLASIKTPGIPLINWIGDGTWLMDFIEGVAPQYDLFFTFDNETVRRLSSKGINTARYLPFGFDSLTQQTQPVMGCEDFSSDLIFVGSPTPERISMFAYLQEHLLGGNQYSLAIWGPSEWGSTPMAHYYRGRSLVGGEMYAAFCASKIVLNVHYGFEGADNCPYYSGINNRVFETGGIGAFCLSSYQDDMLHTFSSTLPTFTSFEELESKIRYYMETPALRLVAVESFQKEILEQHTLSQRIEEIKSAVAQIR